VIDDSESDADPEYRIAYDVARCKVGCVLIQAARGGDVPHDLFYSYFPDEAWTVNATGCQIYPIRKSQRPLLVAKTNFDREPTTKSSEASEVTDA
jgi:hypothetical protein